jgi:hypothetical protein
MGKKEKKSYKKAIGSFVRNNRVMLAAIAGAATGVTLTSLLGTEKAKRVINGVEESVKDFVKNSGRKLQEAKYPA